MTTATPQARKAKRAKNDQPMMPPDIVRLISAQDYWSEKDFLALDSNIGAWMIELVNHRLEILPKPTPYHQDIVIFLLLALREFVMPRGLGRVCVAPMPVRLFPGTLREPDVAFFKKNRIKNKRKPPEGADLAIEVVSPGADNRERDLEEKRDDYAKAKIPEYWTVDPEESTITVLTLSGKIYKVHGVFKEGDHATSKLLKGFKVAVSEVFAAGDGK